MNKTFKLSAMLTAPYLGGYEDRETMIDYYALYGAIEQGDDAIALPLFEKYTLMPPFESDHYEEFDTDKDYAMDADLDGVYLYRRCPARKEYEVFVDITFSQAYKVLAESREQAIIMAEQKANENPIEQARLGTYLGAQACDCEECNPGGLPWWETSR